MLAGTAALLAAMLCSMSPAPAEAPSTVASAGEPVHVAAHELTTATGDGRAVVLGYRRETVRRVGGLPFTTREALVSGEAYASVDRTGSSGLKEATLAIGYQVGCAMALGPVMLQMNGLATLLGVNSDPIRSNSSTITVIPPEPPMASLYPGVAIAPGFTAELKIGGITDIPLAQGAVRDGKALVGIRPTDIKVGGCLGSAAVRSYAVLTTKSALADDTVVVYGDPVMF